MAVRRMVTANFLLSCRVHDYFRDVAADGSDADSTCWGDLPEDVKELILGILPARDVAKAAATCLDFARRVKLGVINAKVLSIPLGKQVTGIKV